MAIVRSPWGPVLGYPGHSTQPWPPRLTRSFASNSRTDTTILSTCRGVWSGGNDALETNEMEIADGAIRNGKRQAQERGHSLRRIEITPRGNGSTTENRCWYVQPSLRCLCEDTNQSGAIVGSNILVLVVSQEEKSPSTSTTRDFVVELSTNITAGSESPGARAASMGDRSITLGSPPFPDDCLFNTFHYLETGQSGSNACRLSRRNR